MKSYRKLILIIYYFSLVNQGVSQRVKTPVTETRVKFTENITQWDKRIRFRAQLDGGVLFLQNNCFTYNFYDKETLRNNHIGKRTEKLISGGSTIRSHAFRMSFLNANQSPKISTGKATSDYCNFFIGNNKKHWSGGVKNFSEVYFKGLYQGIDMQVLGMENSVKYNFIVAPHANTDEIKLLYEGLDRIKLNKGALTLTTSVNEMQEQAPMAYQIIDEKKVEVLCDFFLQDNIVQFKFPNGYNKNLELIIDPILVFACSSGSLADNFGMTATFDAQGNLYSGGTCFNQGFPTTLGAYDTSYNGNVQSGRTDVVITKYDSSGTFLRYSTYLGGTTSTEIVTSLIVDRQDNLLIYGATGSSDFPTTSSAFDTTFNGGTYLSFYFNGTTFGGGTDIYVAKFNPMGTALLASTYLGGNGNDGVNTNNDTVLIGANTWEYPLDSLQYNYGDQYRGEINVDSMGNAYVSSSTRSSNFPIVNGFDNVLGGKQDAVIFKLNSNFSQLIWSTYLGGSDNDAGYALALDDSLNVYVTGGTRSTNFPTTSGVLKPNYSGGKADGYVAKIKKDGTAILCATYWGTNSYDQTYFVQLDQSSNVYVVGQTEGSMPISAGVYHNSGSGQFITKMNKTLNTLSFSTVFGNGNGMPNISPAAFLVDDCGNIYVSGWGGNIITGVATNGMPLTSNAIQPSTDGFNFYLFVLSPNASSLVYATYFGGPLSREHVDGGTSRFDKKGIVYQSVCAGCGGHNDFPVTTGSWPYTSPNFIPDSSGVDQVGHPQEGINMNSNCNNGTFKFDFQVPPVAAQFTVDSLNGCAPYSITFHNQSTSWGNCLWNFGNGDTTSIVFNPTHVFTIPGTYEVSLVVNNGTCVMADTAIHNITVYEGITSNFDFLNTPCTNILQLYDSSHTAPINWQWNFGDGQLSNVQNPIHVYANNGNYNISLISANIHGCKDTTIIQFDNLSGISVNAPTSVCAGNSTELLASGGISYSWAPAINLSSPSIANPTASPANTTTYTVSITFVNPQNDTCTQQLTTTVSVYTPATFPLIATSDKDTISNGQSTILHALTDTTLSVIWSPALGLNSTTSFNPIASPTVTTTYTVTISDSSGCPKTAMVTVYVVSMKCSLDDVFVPNTFTPNGDGTNDVLYVRSNSLSSVYFAVYDRWGELIFETSDLKIGWDGIIKGEPASPDVFAWYIKATCYNGEELKKKGNVTLIR